MKPILLSAAAALVVLGLVGAGLSGQIQTGPQFSLERLSRDRDVVLILDTKVMERHFVPVAKANGFVDIGGQRFLEIEVVDPANMPALMLVNPAHIVAIHVRDRGGFGAPPGQPTTTEFPRKK